MIRTAQTAKSFTLEAKGKAAPIIVSSDDWPGVQHAADEFAQDVQRVTGALPTRSAQASDVDAVLVGTMGHSSLIDDLVRSGKLSTAGVAGQWEAGVTEVVENPMPGVKRALVIAGADKRGTIFGLYTLSEQIGVSPWYWWADVPVKTHDALYVKAGRHVMATPAVKYRGIFLNDEAPALTNWAQEKFGGKNSKFYTHVFELLLRLRANYLWPAMWDNAFNEDDPLNPKLADEYGIVMGTSHHEPMIRAQKEWHKHGTGEWDYTTNKDVLTKFWTEGIARNKEYESTITIGMRGDGDMAMSASANTKLLEGIVADQRKIIAEKADPKVKNPQIWALYKEVQEYYEKGMRVPDDVTLLWCDDNWGNNRRLPTAAERKRPGGAGIYYHFDYVGDPRSYKWLNVTPITKVWEQMHLALQYGADRVWIVNVGDLKPMEFPIEFFLTMARDPKLWDKDHLQQYTDAWSAREFGAEHGAEIGELISGYSKLNRRRTPELLEPETYSFTEGHEADRVQAEWAALVKKADAVRTQLPQEYQAAYFELAYYPVKASAVVNDMMFAAGRNHLYAKQGRASANHWADVTRSLFAEDAKLSAEYNGLLDGRWNHMMDQTHLGYYAWFDPPRNIMPAVSQVDVPQTTQLGVYPEGGAGKYMHKPLPEFDSVNRQTRTIDLGLMGTKPVSFTATTSAPWIVLSKMSGDVVSDEAIAVSIDWSKAPKGRSEGSVTITDSTHNATKVMLNANNLAHTRGFVEDAGAVTIDAAQFMENDAASGVRWEVLPDFGETRSGIESFPVLAPSTEKLNEQACVSYEFTLTSAGTRTLETILAPTLPFQPDHGLRFTVGLDHAAAITADMWPKLTDEEWRKAVSDGVRRVSVPLGELAAGAHTMHVCRVDAGVVLERFVIYGEHRPGEYLGPIESAVAKP
ncbi:glycosyl hydrolase 115 family protein [Granulicella cerasi]|uniref:Glycosyl hydrolase 115 family protein n=1 Tax=Granulicella cerasi TaxID=741063 RepID=A0ABW1ZC61_9BACT|nr:glycosyl hydrolase 115 family protein [Granulicella cerasi]